MSDSPRYTHRSVGRTEQRTVARNGDARDRNVLLGKKLMCACILREVPYPHAARTIAADDLALIRMNHHIIHRRPVIVAALNGAGFGFPDFDRSVLRTRHHPFALAVKRHAGNVPSVTLKCQQRVGIRRLDIVELDGVVARRGQKSLVGGNAEPVHLGIGMLDRARANARQSFPESDGVVISRCKCLKSVGRD